MAEAHVLVPSALREYVGGASALAVAVPAQGSPLAEVLGAALGPWPMAQRRVRDERDEIRTHVNVFVDGEDVKRGAGLATTVRPGSRVHILASVAGG
ncbi:MAG TPA: MoaD/ThiS family protein [Candidatus Lustribacter sp.]|nr:MoaD/ThiS family protein [Candidatus Lustribacter sp.]